MIFHYLFAMSLEHCVPELYVLTLMVIKANEIGVKWKGVGGTECSETARGLVSLKSCHIFIFQLAPEIPWQALKLSKMRRIGCYGYPQNWFRALELENVFFFLWVTILESVKIILLQVKGVKCGIFNFWDSCDFNVVKSLWVSNFATVLGQSNTS